MEEKLLNQRNNLENFNKEIEDQNIKFTRLEGQINTTKIEKNGEIKKLRV